MARGGIQIGAPICWNIDCTCVRLTRVKCLRNLQTQLEHIRQFFSRFLYGASVHLNLDRHTPEGLLNPVLAHAFNQLKRSELFRRNVYFVSLCVCFLLRDGPVDLVGGGGGGRMEEFVKKKFADPQKGIKKFLHTQHCEKKKCKAKHQSFSAVYVY